MCLHMLFAAPAFAHVGHDVQRAERYLKFELEGSQLRVVVTMTLGRTAMLGALQRADENHDGTVSRQESEAYLAAWTASLSDALPLFVDGERVPLTWGSPYMAPIGVVTQVEGAVEAVAVLPFDAQLFDEEHLVVLQDHMEVPEFERTDVRFVGDAEAMPLVGLTDDLAAAPEVELSGTHELSFLPGQGQVHLAMVVVLPGNRWPFALAGAVILTGLSLLVLWRRRRDKT